MIQQDGSVTAQLIAADWHEDRGENVVAESLREDAADVGLPWNYEWCWRVGGGVADVVGG